MAPHQESGARAVSRRCAGRHGRPVLSLDRCAHFGGPLRVGVTSGPKHGISRWTVTLISLAAAFVAGVLLGESLEPPTVAIGLLGLASLLLLAFLVTIRYSPFPAVLLVVVVLGLSRVALFDPDTASGLTAYHGPVDVEIEGIVTSDAEPASGSLVRFHLAVDRIRPNGEWLNRAAVVLVTLSPPRELVQRRESPYVRYGDRLVLSGSLEAPPEVEDFDYPAYLARQGIGSVMSFPDATIVEEDQASLFYRWLHDVRRGLASSLTESVPEPQASVGQALLLGLRHNLPDGLVDDFRKTGTSHLLAISGLHVSVLLGLSLAVSRWAFGRRRQLYLLAPLVLMWLYALLAGATPSVTRAAIMGTVFLAATALGGPRSVLPALGVAAAVMVALNSTVLWSISFQLSFAAMAGIAVLAEPVGRWLGPNPESPDPEGSSSRTVFTLLTDSVAMTIAATVATFPLVAFHFQQISLIGVPATALSLPALPSVIVSQTVAATLGTFADFLALPFAWLAWATTAYVTGVVGLLARLPGTSIQTGQVAPFLVWAYYGVFLLVFVFRSSVRRAGERRGLLSVALPFASRGVPLWALVPAVAVAVLAWIAVLTPNDGMLRVTI